MTTSTALNQTWTKIRRAFRRRPVRVVEAVIALAGTLGLALQPEATEAILTLVGLVLVGGEYAQTKTTPTAEPRLDDGHRGEG